MLIPGSIPRFVPSLPRNDDRTAYPRAPTIRVRPVTATPLRQLSDWPTPLFSAEDEAALYHRPGPAFFSLLLGFGEQWNSQPT